VTAELRAASRLRLQDDVISVLRDAIVSGAFAPGEHLREEELAERLKVSRGPVRQALAVMEHEGLVRIEPHRGARVPLLASKDVDEVYSLRLSLETLAARWAVSNADDQDLAHLAGVVKEIPAVVAGGSPRELTDVDLAFHDAFYRAAHHERLFTCWRAVRSQVAQFLFSRNTVTPTTREIMIDGHAALLDLLTRRAEGQLAAAVEEHLRSAYERLRTQYS
jgi:DNA-binding GntR family transcriptional regulator